MQADKQLCSLNGRRKTKGRLAPSIQRTRTKVPVSIAFIKYSLVMMCFS